MEPESRWFYSVWSVLLALFVVLGPFGLPLLWRSPRFSRAAKVLLTALTAVYTLVLLRETFDGLDRAARAGDRERHAGVHRLAVHEHGAGAARPFVAHALRAGEPEHLAQRVEERAMRRNVHADAPAIDLERDVDGTRTDELGSLGHESIVRKKRA